MKQIETQVESLSDALKLIDKWIDSEFTGRDHDAPIWEFTENFIVWLYEHNRGIVRG